MNRKWTLRLLVLAMVLSLALTGCNKATVAPTAEPTEVPTEEPTAEPDEQAGPVKLIIGTSADYEPFEFIAEDGSYTGFDVELMEEAAKRMGVEIEWQDIGFDGLIGALQSDKIDAIIACMSATPDREEMVDFTEPYFIGADAIIVAEGSDITITANEDLAGYKVGVQSGTIQESWIDENIDAEVSRYDRAEQAIQDLIAGRVDVVAMDFYAAGAFIDQGGVTLALKTEFAGEHMSIAVQEGNADLLAQFNAVIDEMQADGFVDDLAVKYFAAEAAATDEEPMEATEPVQLVIGTSADYEPFEFIAEDGSYTGFDIELMEEAAKRMGAEIEWQDIGFDGLIGALQSDKIDAIIACMSATPDREEMVDFTEPYFIGADAIIVAEGSDITITANEDMAGYKVGVQSGTIQESWIDENIDAEVSRYDRAEQAIQDLIAGRVDVVAMDFYAAGAFIDQGGVTLALKTEFAGEHMSIAVQEGNADLLAQFNAVIDEMQADGFVDELAMKYFSGE